MSFMHLLVQRLDPEDRINLHIDMDDGHVEPEYPADAFNDTDDADDEAFEQFRPAFEDWLEGRRNG